MNIYYAGDFERALEWEKQASDTSQMSSDATENMTSRPKRKMLVLILFEYF